jgi:F0F1-type ATP synthase assembly protein I
MKKSNDSEKTSRAVNEIGPYLGLGFQLAASIVLMFFLGQWLDGKFHIFPVLTITFSFLGGAAGIYNLIKTVLELGEKKKKREKDN